MSLNCHCQGIYIYALAQITHWYATVSWRGTRLGSQVCGTETMKWCKRSELYAPWWTNTGSTVSQRCLLKRWTVNENRRTDALPKRPPPAPPSASRPTLSSWSQQDGSRIIIALFFSKLILILFLAKGYPRASCGRMARCVPLRYVCIFRSKLRNVMNLCNKLRYISNLGWWTKFSSIIIRSGSLVSEDGRFSRAVS